MLEFSSSADGSLFLEDYAQYRVVRKDRPPITFDRSTFPPRHSGDPFQVSEGMHQTPFM